MHSASFEISTVVVKYKLRKLFLKKKNCEAKVLYYFEKIKSHFFSMSIPKIKST